MGKQQAVETHQHRCAGGNLQRHCAGLQVQSAHQQAGGDPPDGPQHSHPGEFPFRALHVVKGQGVGERQGRHVAQGVNQQHREDFPEGSQIGHPIQQAAAHQVQSGKHLFRRIETVGHQAHEKRRDHGRDGRSGIGPADLTVAEAKGLTQIGDQGDVPGPPDEILQKHHGGELQANHSSTSLLEQSIGLPPAAAHGFRRLVAKKLIFLLVFLRVPSWTAFESFLTP